MEFLETMLEKLNKEDKEINNFLEICVDKEIFLSDFVILSFFKISLIEFQKLQNYFKNPDLPTETIDCAKIILYKINNLKKLINSVNDAIIKKSNNNISREKMNWLLKNKEANETETTIINIKTEDQQNREKLNLEKLGVK